MENTDELNRWVNALSVAEKRFVKVLGKARSGTRPSQQLMLFDWLNKTEEPGKQASGIPFKHNLPTVSTRLKELILDSLRILNKAENADAEIRNGIENTIQLLAKKLVTAAQRELKRTKKIALDTCRYAEVLQCIALEQQLLQAQPAGDVTAALREMQQEEMALCRRRSEQRELQYRHDLMLALVKKFPFHRDAKTLREIHELSESELVYRNAESGGYLEQALAVNLLGIKYLYERNPYAAVLVYKKLLKSWESRPEWQIDQAPLLLHICKFYQNACLYCPVDWEETRQFITMAYNFKGLSPDVYRGFRRMLYWNQFALALNTGKFETVQTLIPEIDQWMEEQGDELSEAQRLPFLYNFAAAEFLQGNYVSANRFVVRILNMPNRNVRKDIREFALVLQAVLHYELGNTELNEYLTRAGKRHFANQSFEIKFELAVFKYLDVLNRAESPKNMRESLGRFREELDELAAQLTDTIPLLGLNEIRMWAEARHSGKLLRDVFLEEVKKNLEALERTERV